MKHQLKTNTGFMALISAIIISVILLLIATNLSQTSFYSRYNILESELKEASSALAEACVDTALLKLANKTNYNPINEVVPVGMENCTIQSIDNNPLPITIHVQVNYKNYYTTLQVSIDTDTLKITRWEEI